MNQTAQKLITAANEQSPSADIISQMHKYVHVYEDDPAREHLVSLQIGDSVKPLLIQIHRLGQYDRNKEVLIILKDPAHIASLASRLSEESVKREKAASIERTRKHEWMLEKPIESFIPSDFNLNEMEKEIIQKAILFVKKQDHPKEQAADLLGISRATLFRKIKQYRLS